MGLGEHDPLEFCSNGRGHSAQRPTLPLPIVQTLYTAATLRTGHVNHDAGSPTPGCLLRVDTRNTIKTRLPNQRSFSAHPGIAHRLNPITPGTREASGLSVKRDCPEQGAGQRR